MIDLVVRKELRLKPLEIENAPDLFHLVDRNRSYLREFLGWLDCNLSESSTVDFIQKEQTLQEMEHSLTLAIWHKGSLVGLVNLHKIDVLNLSASIGYWLDESHQGQGIMRQSVEALIDYGHNR